jgi:hypothetical protein
MKLNLNIADNNPTKEAEIIEAWCLSKPQDSTLTDTQYAKKAMKDFIRQKTKKLVGGLRNQKNPSNYDPEIT